MVSGYLVYGPEHFSCVGNSLYSSTEDVQRQLQPLQDLTALTVQTQPLQCLKTHTNTHVSQHSSVSFEIICHTLYLQGLPASGQLQLNVLLSQVAGVLLRLQPLLQGVLITAESQSDL